MSYRQLTAENWATVADQSAAAAKECHRSRHYRSATSRAYYAAYSILTAFLIEKRVGWIGGRIDFGKGRTNPDHRQLRLAMRQQWVRVERTKQGQQRLIQALSQLWQARVTGDYQPSLVHGEQESIQSLHNMGVIWRAMSKEASR